MSDISRPASAMASLAAMTASLSGGIMMRRPTGDMPRPVMATLSSNFSVVAIGRTQRRWSSGGVSSEGSSATTSLSGSNIGSHTSSTLWNRTVARIPTLASSAFGPTRLVMTRTRGSSSIATDAMASGGGNAGSQSWWLTVTPTMTPRPDTSVSPMSSERQ